MSSTTTSKPLIVLDLDGTLIYSYSDVEYEQHDILWASTNDRQPDMLCGNYKVFFRPHAKEMVIAMLEKCDVGVFTASGKEYATMILQKLLGDVFDRLSFVMTRDRCVVILQFEFDVACDGLKPQAKVMKPLSKIWRTHKARSSGWTRRNTIIVDDTPSSCDRNYGNAVYVSEYRPYRYDDVLRKLERYILDYLVGLTDVRFVEKRMWYK